MEFNPHEVQWNEEKIIRFWNNRPTPESFAGTAARGIVSFVKRYGNISGVALDYGCGRGDFLDELCKENVTIIAADNSEGVLRGVHERFGDAVQSVQIKDLPLPLEDHSVDWIFFNAVVEHLLPETLDATVREFRRLLKEGGRVIVSCPHDENLRKYHTVCPDCGGIFHYMQHVGSYSVPTLTAYMERHGFKTIGCESSWLDDDRSFEGRLKNVYHWVRRKMGRGQKLPHLIYLGRM